MIKAMPKVRWNVFYKSFCKMNKQQLNSKQISKRGGISASYCKKMLTKPTKDEHKTITLNMIERIGKGLGLQPNSTKNWAKQLQISNQAKTKKTETKQSPDNTQITYQTIRITPLGKYLRDTIHQKQLARSMVVKKSFINRQWLEQILDGKRPVVKSFTLMQIAIGLKIPFNQLLKHNIDNVKIKKIPIKKAHQSTAPKTTSTSNNNQSLNHTLSSMIGQLNTDDKLLIKRVMERLISAENKEK